MPDPSFNFRPATHKSLTSVQMTLQVPTFSTDHFTLAASGSAVNVRVPMEQLNFGLETITAVINAWGGSVVNEVPVRNGFNFGISIYMYDDGYDPNPFGVFNYSSGPTFSYVKMVWVQRSIGGTTHTLTHTLYAGIRKVSDTFQGDGGQVTNMDLFSVDLVDGSGNPAWYTRAYS